jgi:hypothetical protein
MRPLLSSPAARFLLAHGLHILQVLYCGSAARSHAVPAAHACCTCFVRHRNKAAFVELRDCNGLACQVWLIQHFDLHSDKRQVADALLSALILI